MQRSRTFKRLTWSLGLLALLLSLLGSGSHAAAWRGERGPQEGDNELSTVEPAPPVLPAEPLHDVMMPSAPDAAPTVQRHANPANDRNAAVDAAVDAAETTLATEVVSPSLDLRILVISATQTDETLGAIRQILDYVGAAYTVWIAAERPGQLTPATLASGGHGFYNAVFLTTSNLAYTPDGGVTWLSALSAQEWQSLWAYEAAFKVRQVTWYTFPTADYGFSSSTSLSIDATPYPLRLTAAGQAAFPHLKPNVTLNLRYTYAYPAMLTAGDPNIQALITDSQGRVFAATRLYPDGRENLAFTFTGNQYLVHTIATSYGLLSWATRGLFLGEFRTYMQPQVDDYFIENDIFTTSTPCGTNLDLNPSGVTYRMNSGDVTALVRWQNNRRNQAITANLRLSMVFNGTGADPASSGGTRPADDTLVPATRQSRGNFFWVTHTYEHLLLNDTTLPVSEYTRQLQKNHDVARRLSFNNYNQASLVTPEISGLNNQPFLDEAYRWGIRYMVSDASRPEQRAPSPNTGYANALRPEILMIPRNANNLFYNVSQPDEWTHEYNCLYNSFWGRNLTAQEIIDKESDLLAGFMLRGDISPWMFHQANLRAYNGRNSLLTDLLDATLAKYNALYRLPVQSLNQHQIAQKLIARDLFNRSGVTATLTGSQLSLTTQSGATIPVTGVCTVPAGSSAVLVRYNNQCTLSVPMGGSSTVTLTVP